jgi:hypothetical protein
MRYKELRQTGRHGPQERPSTLQGILLVWSLAEPDRYGPVYDFHDPSDLYIDSMTLGGFWARRWDLNETYSDAYSFMRNRFEQRQRRTFARFLG